MTSDDKCLDTAGTGVATPANTDQATLAGSCILVYLVEGTASGRSLRKCCNYYHYS